MTILLVWSTIGAAGSYLRLSSGLFLTGEEQCANLLEIEVLEGGEASAQSLHNSRLQFDGVVLEGYLGEHWHVRQILQ